MNILVDSKSYTIILLAAGSSSRFGSPKQLAQNNGMTLIHHSVSEAIKVHSDVIVVLGANIDIVKKEIENFPVQIVYNKDWEEGMSSSIRSGITALLNRNPSAEAAIIAVIDQPFLSSTIIADLIEKYEATKKPVVACAYKDVIGTPALFDKSFFQPLLELKGQSGAKKIISQNKNAVVTIPFHLGYIDIDTKEDYENFKNLNKS